MKPERLILAVLISLANLSLVQADRLQLSNGDEIEGDLIEMSGNTIKFRHSVLGELTVPRDRVHAVELGKERGGKRIMSDGSEAPPETPEEVMERLINPNLNEGSLKEIGKNAKRHPSPEDAVEQLRREGVSGKTMSQLHGLLPGFGSPKVQDHFQDRVTGLMTGSLTINDIREEAIDVRDQLEELMEELGPSGEALRGYHGILDGFIQKTDPEKPLTVPGIPPLTPKPIAPQSSERVQ